MSEFALDETTIEIPLSEYDEVMDERQRYKDALEKIAHPYFNCGGVGEKRSFESLVRIADDAITNTKREYTGPR